MKPSIKKYLVFVPAILALTSCKRIIEMDIDDSEPKLVIEALVGTNEFDNIVKISKSKGLNSSLPYTQISGAKVQITDITTNTLYELMEIQPGQYKHPSLTGNQTHQYTLNVETEGTAYTAKSYLPKRIPMDLLYQKDKVEYNKEDKKYFVNVGFRYKDPAGERNFYAITILKNNVPTKEMVVLSDRWNDGLVVNSELNIEANVGDELLFDFQCIDQPTYDYLFGLIQNVRQTSGTPANPVSNISNGSLGYFKTHTSSIHRLIIK